MIRDGLVNRDALQSGYNRVEIINRHEGGIVAEFGRKRVGAYTFEALVLCPTEKDGALCGVNLRNGQIIWEWIPVELSRIVHRLLGFEGDLRADLRIEGLRQMKETVDVFYVQAVYCRVDCLIMMSILNGEVLEVQRVG